MKEAANSLLKVLEEPPEFATIFLLAENAGRVATDYPLSQHDAAIAKPYHSGNRRVSDETSPRLETAAAGLGRKAYPKAPSAAQERSTWTPTQPPASMH